MNLSRLSKHLVIAGFVAGAFVSTFLWFYTGPEYHPAILGFRGLIHFFVFPFVGAVVALGWTNILWRFLGKLFGGVILGLLVAALSFVTFNFLLSVYVAAVFVGCFPFEFLHLFLAYTLFGGVFLGWAILGIGAFAGWLATRDGNRP